MYGAGDGRREPSQNGGDTYTRQAGTERSPAWLSLEKFTKKLHVTNSRYIFTFYRYSETGATMSAILSLKDQALSIVQKTGILRPRDLDQYGIPREILRRLCNRGVLIRIARGMYSLPDAEVTEHHTLVQVCKRFPNGVICRTCHGRSIGGSQGDAGDKRHL